MGRRYRFSFKRMDVYRAAVEHFVWVCDVVQRMPKGPFRVVDQTVGAALSVMSNLGEAHGRDPKLGEIEQHYRYAYGSTFESAAQLDALAALGVIDDDEYNEAEERLARIGMMLTRLMQKQRRRKLERRRATATRQADAPARIPAQPGRAERSEARFESRASGPGGAKRPPGSNPAKRAGQSEATVRFESREAGPRRARSDRRGSNP